MTREELDRLAELRSAIAGGGPVSDAVVAEWDHAIFAAAPALLAAARERDELLRFVRMFVRWSDADDEEAVAGEGEQLEMLGKMARDLLARVTP